MATGPKLMASIIGDLAGAIGIPGGGTLGVLIEKMMEARTEAAAQILLEELRKGVRTLTDADLPDAVPKFHRYIRAAQEGAAKQNLRLIARVFAGKQTGKPIYADEFLAIADVLAGLRPEECRVLGIWADADTPVEGTPEAGQEIRTYKVMMVRVQDELGMDERNALATVNALTRTGLVIAQPGWSGGIYVLSPMFHRLRKLDLWTIVETET